MSAKPILAFLSSNTSGTGKLFVEKSRQMGFHPLLFTEDASRFESFSGLAEIVALDPNNPDSILEFLRPLSVKGVLTTSEYYLSAAADVARRKGLQGPDPSAVTRCRDKARQRRTLVNGNVNQPRFFEVDSPADAARAITTLNGPVIIKPVDGTGSIGVKLAAGDEAVNFAAQLLTRDQDERGRPAAKRALIEQFIDGNEYSVELFHGKAINVTQKYLGEKPYFVEIGHTYPAPVSEAERKELIDTASRAVEVLGLQYGPIHVEVRLLAGRAYIIEVNARLAGGFIPRLIELTGTDLIARTIAATTGISPPPDPPARGAAAAIRFITASATKGTFRRVNNIGAAMAIPKVVEIEVYARPGAKIARFGDFRDRIGHAIAVGNDPSAASKSADAALARLHTVVDPMAHEHVPANGEK